MKKHFVLAILLIIQCSSFLMGQVKNPVIPDMPSINGEIDFSVKRLRGKVSLYGKEGSIEGDIIFNTDTIVTGDGRKFELKYINRITVLEWEKRSSLKNNVFYPSRYELLFHDYRKVIIKGNIELLNRLRFTNREYSILYLYYYDYFKDGKWTNSGVSDSNAVFLKPSAGCVVSIEFVQ